MKSLSRNQITEQNYLCLGPILCRFLFESGSHKPGPAPLHITHDETGTHNRVYVSSNLTLHHCQF